VYAAAEPEERRRAHRAVASTLPPGDVERRAWHLGEATVGIDDEVADLLELVGERCLARGAHAVSATAFERAALATSREESAARRFLAAGRAAWLAGQVERAEELLSRASRSAVADALTAEIDGLRGDIALRAGSVERAREVLVGAASVLDTTDPDAAVALLGDAMTASHYLADAAAGVEIVGLIDRALPRCRTSRARILGELSAGIGQVLAGHPDGPERIRRAVDEAPAPDDPDDQVRPAWTVLGPLFLRESGRGRDLAEQVATALRRRCALVTLPTLLFHIARHDATTDRWEQSVTEYSEGITLARETGQSTDLTLCLAGLAWVQARRGREEEARRHASEAAELAQRHQIHLARICAAFAMGELELALGRPEAAVAELQGLSEFLAEVGFQDVDLSPEPELAEALHHLGRTEEAVAVALSFHGRARAKSQPWSLARAERACALCEGGAGEARFRRALELHGATRDGFELARTELAFGAVLRRERRRVDARPVLRSALATFNRLGAMPWAEIAAVELAATGEAPLRAGEDELGQLTSQELQIARLLGDGRTTREAAAALFLSPKTVEYHLRHVYTKLGIASRAELAAHLRSSGGQ
jgi:DNA-binding CsgD family transcriptional regulator